MTRADDRPNKASQGLGPSLSALPLRCPLCSLRPLLYPLWAHVVRGSNRTQLDSHLFLLLLLFLRRDPQRWALVTALTPRHLSAFSPRWHSLLVRAGCVQYPFTFFCFPSCHSHFVIFSRRKYEAARVMWSKPGPLASRGGAGRCGRD